jgi:hypothetical protein
MNILTVNLLFSTLVFGIAARLYLMPAISRLEARSVVLPILLLHSMRHLGLMFLAPGAVFPGIPQQFTYPAALGELRGACAHQFLPCSFLAARAPPFAAQCRQLQDLIDAISRHHLRLSPHGACVLDTRLLGSGAPRHPLCCVCPSGSALVWADVSNLTGTKVGRQP